MTNQDLVREIGLESARSVAAWCDRLEEHGGGGSHEPEERDDVSVAEVGGGGSLEEELGIGTRGNNVVAARKATRWRRWSGEGKYDNGVRFREGKWRWWQWQNMVET